MEKPELPVVEGNICRCPVEDCHCEISIERPPQNLPPTQPFIDCCGHEMVKVSVDESYGWGEEEGSKPASRCPCRIKR